MLPIRKLIASNENYYIYFIYQNKYINKENISINILPKIVYTIITNRHKQQLHFVNVKRHIITFGWLMFEITIDYCYNLNKNYHVQL